MNQAINNFAYDCLHMKTVKLTDLFDIVNVNDLKQIETTDNDNILYPLIGNTSHNNSIVDYVNYYNFEGDCICISSSVPIVGFCSVHHGKIAINDNIIIIKLKDKFKHLSDCLSCFAGNMTQYFHLKYLKSFCIIIQQLTNEFIPRVPFIQSPDNPHKMIIDTEGLKYAFNFWNEGCDDKNKHYNPSEIKMKKIKLIDIFKVCKNNNVVDRNASKPGPYNYISIMGTNNGICGTIDHFEFDGNYITVSIDGNSAGCCFAQHGKFTTTQNVKVLELKPEYKHLENCLSIIAYIMTLNFKNIYGYHYKFLS